ncbi:alpha-L-arabinofuranosidase [Puia sp.]|uniref:alpha-L-arabinofuranosidase n=1 Tax=Puia sp. TaxID=2045100 RepID=UPI002F40F4F0
MNKILVLLGLCCLLNANHPHPAVPAAGAHPHPAAAPTIGFFLDDWSEKKFLPPTTQESERSAITKQTPVLTIDPDSTITLIPPGEFGHNINTWMGSMVSQRMFMTNLRNLQPHVIRWPAGSGSDAYFWNAGPFNLPADIPKQIVNKDGKKETPIYFYGRPLNGFATLDEYYKMLMETGNEGLITVNYGYARYGTSAEPVATAAHLAADWVRYDHGRTRYWEIGNENNGTWEYGYRIDTTDAHWNGQPKLLSGALYGKHFRVFADSMRKAAAETGSSIYIGAVTVEGPPHPWDLPITRNWNAGMMPGTRDCADYYVVHNYFTPYNKNSTAAEILNAAVTIPGEQMRYVTQSLHDNGVPIKPVAMDEWNMFARGNKQQVSNTSGLFSVLVMGETLRNKYGLAARWDLINGWDGGNDHGLFSAGDEPGVTRFSPRPSFYYLYYLQRFMGDHLLNSTLSGDTTIKAYASGFSSGEVGAALVNPGTTPTTIRLDIRHFRPGKNFYWYTLAGDSPDEFPRRVLVNGQTTTAPGGGPADYATIPAFTATTAKGICITVPARGAVFLVVGK